MATDLYPSARESIGPGRLVFAITPHDVDEIPIVPRALYFNASGWVTVKSFDSSSDHAIYVQAGQMLDLRVSHIRSTGTSLVTAANAPSGASQILGIA